MTINIAHRADLERRVEKLAERMGLKGHGRKTATIERALGVLEERLEQEQPDREAIRASLDGYIANGARLRRRLAGKVAAGTVPLSQALQDELYDERGLPK